MKLLARIGIAAGIVAICALGFWYASKNSPAVSESPTPTPTSTELPKITYGQPDSDWATYSSASLGFQVRYPKDWHYASCGDGCVAFANASQPDVPLMGINVTEDTTELTDLLTSAKDFIKSNEKVSYNGVNWTRLILQEPQTMSIFVSHFATSGSKMYEFGIGVMDADTLAVYGKMVHSFSLLKK